MLGAHRSSIAANVFATAVFSRAFATEIACEWVSPEAHRSIVWPEFGCSCEPALVFTFQLLSFVHHMFANWRRHSRKQSTENFRLRYVRWSNIIRDSAWSWFRFGLCHNNNVTYESHVMPTTGRSGKTCDTTWVIGYHSASVFSRNICSNTHSNQVNFNINSVNELNVRPFANWNLFYLVRTKYNEEVKQIFRRWGHRFRYHIQLRVSPEGFEEC